MIDRSKSVQTITSVEDGKIKIINLDRDLESVLHDNEYASVIEQPTVFQADEIDGYVPPVEI